MDLIKRIAEKRLKPRHEEDMEFGPFSEPIYCWSQAEWNDEWLEYAHDYCFVESTYYIPSNITIPMRNSRNNNNDRISYYQWIPFILVIQAIICLLPNYIWIISNLISSKNLPSILKQSHTSIGKESENNVAADIGRHLTFVLLNSELNLNKQEGLGIFCKFGYYISKNILSFLYLLIKCLFLLINIGQLIFISFFLGTKQTPFWGIQMVKLFLNYGSAWKYNGLFPRVSLCDFKIRMQNDIFVNFTVQCVLMANYKIFFVLYYWFALMTIITFLNILRWFWILFCPSINYFQKQIELSALEIYADQFIFDNNNNQNNYNLNIIQHFDENIIFNNNNKKECQSPTNTLNSEITTITTVTSSNEIYNSCIDEINNKQNNNFKEENESINNSINKIPINSFNQNEEFKQFEPKNSVKLTIECKNKNIENANNRSNFKISFNKYKYNFVEKMGMDGVLIFQLINANTGPRMVSLIIGELFKNYIELMKNKK